MQKILFICSRNRLRSPTAEAVFAQYPGIETRSAGLAPDADDPLCIDHFEGIHLIFVMEKSHLIKLKQKFHPWYKNVRVICLDIPDKYGFMQDELVSLLRARVTPHLKIKA